MLSKFRPNLSVFARKVISCKTMKSFSTISTDTTDTVTTKLKVPLDGYMYTDPKYYDIERKELLGKSWQFLSHESALIQNGVNAGATYLADTVSGWPVIIVRDTKNGNIKGYHNICRHRAGPLEWNGTSGVCKINGLKCKYHGWTFTFDGKLRGMPRFGDSSSIDKNDYNLWPIRVANYNGLIFVQTLPPDDNLPHYGAECDALFLSENKEFCKRVDAIEGMKDFTVIKSATHVLKCNWKVGRVVEMYDM